MAALRRILRVANDRRIEQLDHLLLTVADVHATCDFDARVPGMQVVSLAKAGLRWPSGSRRSICMPPGVPSHPSCGVQRPNRPIWA
jgi:hypothetical protein